MYLKTNYRNAAGSAVPKEKLITYFYKKSCCRKKKEKKISACHLISAFTSMLGIFLRVKLYFNALLWKPLCIVAQLFPQKHYSGLSHRLFRVLLSYSGLHWLGLLRLNWSAQKSKRYDRLNQAKKITKAAWLDVFTPWRFLSQHLSLAWRSQLLFKPWGVSFWPGLEASA